MEPQDLRLLIGGRGVEKEMAGYVQSPTWIVDEAYEQVWEVATRALDAYMLYCQEHGFAHSYFLGLDILITAAIDPDNHQRLIDIRPTMLEGPCCNSYPASMDFYPSRLYYQAKQAGCNPDIVEYPTHPTKITERILQTFLDYWEAQGNSGRPRIGLFTRPYPESEEEQAHIETLAGFKAQGIEAYRITPDEKPVVREGKIWVHDVPIDMCFRRIERIHVPLFYGAELGQQIITQTPETTWFNNFGVDDLRSKTIEEKAFRLWEKHSGKTVPRPTTLLGEEITPEAVRAMTRTGGYALKRWNSTGGKGVFLHVDKQRAQWLFDRLYKRYDGRHMLLLEPAELEKELQTFADFSEDASIQQFRTIDSRALEDGNMLVYDTRINVTYNSKEKRWEFLSGISRVVPCGPTVENGNSLLTNVSSGAFMAPLIIGHTKDKSQRAQMTFGPLLKALLAGQTSTQL